MEGLWQIEYMILTERLWVANTGWYSTLAVVLKDDRDNCMMAVCDACRDHKCTAASCAGAATPLPGEGSSKPMPRMTGAQRSHSCGWLASSPTLVL